METEEKINKIKLTIGPNDDTRHLGCVWVVTAVTSPIYRTHSFMEWAPPEGLLTLNVPTNTMMARDSTQQPSSANATQAVTVAPNRSSNAYRRLPPLRM